ncbi:hypothetical protein [Oscillatoria nigro-viridis]|nr:hypothetical protein [Oscillatoria nigro-viridis]
MEQAGKPVRARMVQDVSSDESFALEPLPALSPIGVFHADLVKVG